jgi:hypothetical protein
MPLHHVKSHYYLILYYTSTYVERVGVSQHDNACSFITSDLRNRLKNDMLEGLMQLTVYGPHICTDQCDDLITSSVKNW